MIDTILFSSLSILYYDYGVARGISRIRKLVMLTRTLYFTNLDRRLYIQFLLIAIHISLQPIVGTCTPTSQRSID